MIDRFSVVRSDIAEARRRASLTQEKLAEMADVPDSYVRDLETRRRAVSVPGTRRSPDDADRFRRVCGALRLDHVALLRDRGML